MLHHEDPDALTDEEWAQRIADAEFVLRTFADMLFGKMKQAF